MGFFLGILKFGSLILGTVLTLFSLVSDTYKEDSNGKRTLTLRGWLYVRLILLSTAIGAFSQGFEALKQSNDSASAQAEQMRILNEIKSAMNPIFPLNSTFTICFEPTSQEIATWSKKRDPTNTSLPNSDEILTEFNVSAPEQASLLKRWGFKDDLKVRLKIEADTEAEERKSLSAVGQLRLLKDSLIYSQIEKKFRLTAFVSNWQCLDKSLIMSSLRDFRGCNADIWIKGPNSGILTDVYFYSDNGAAFNIDMKEVPFRPISSGIEWEFPISSDQRL